MDANRSEEVAMRLKQRGLDDLPTFSPEEAWAVLEKRTHAGLQIDAQEFLRRWDAGEYADEDTFAVSRAAMLIPFLR